MRNLYTVFSIAVVVTVDIGIINVINVKIIFNITIYSFTDSYNSQSHSQYSELKKTTSYSIRSTKLGVGMPVI